MFTAKSPRRRAALVATVAAALILTGCATDATMEDPPAVQQRTPATITPDTAIGEPQIESPQEGKVDQFFQSSLRVAAQTSDGETVEIQSADLNTVRGWIVVRKLIDGDAPGAILGFAPLQAEGPQENIVIELDPPLEPGNHTLFAAIHQDGEPVGEFNFPGVDNPVVNKEGDRVNERFRVSVEAS